MTMSEFLAKRTPKGMTAEFTAVYFNSMVSAEVIKYRMVNGCTQEQLAARLGVSQGMVSKYESCEYNFSVACLCKLAEKLNLDVTLTIEERSEAYRTREREDWSAPDSMKLAVVHLLSA